jgi:hypothetical protein
MSRFLGWVLGPIFWAAGMYEGARFRRELFPSGILKLLSSVDWYVAWPPTEHAALLAAGQVVVY